MPSKEQLLLRVRVIRVAARSEMMFGWSPTFWTPKPLAGGIGGSILPDEVGK